MTENDQRPPPRDGARWVFLRLVRTLFLLLLLALNVLALQIAFHLPGQGVTVSLGIVFGLPFCLGAIAAFLNNPDGEKPKLSNSVLAVLFVIIVLGLGGIIIREGVICMVILLPLWGASALFGASLVGMFHRKFRERSRLNCSVLIIAPMILLWGESFIPSQTNVFTVERTITINSSVDEVWEEITRLENIKPAEGRWNVTQNLLGIPRPRAAIVRGDGEGAIRYAQWGDNISFEEHIFIWDEHSQMRWQFAFPNDSVHRYTDRHISPDGQHLKVIDGGYRLVPTGISRTQLVLDTRYAVTTPVNLYSAMWGEVILGDIQNNVLKIMKDRVEAKAHLQARK